MFNVRNYEYDCAVKCRLRAHGNRITAALTKRSMPNEKLAAFIAKTCRNYADIVDDLGRSAVHLSASVDRYAILEWLMNQGAIINGRDFESGSSPLHRAIFYGCIDCAVLLLRYGANLDLLDEDTRCPLQNVCRLRDVSSKGSIPANNEILVWGNNKNYNLGIDNEQETDAPQAVDFFRKQHISIEAVALGAYHSLFLDKKSQLYAVGHGKGGRLGIGIENSLAAPKRVKLPIKNAGEVVTSISVSRKHSLLLTSRSAVYACGLNDDQQLGVRDAGEKLTVFKEVITLRDLGVTDLKRVIARDHFSLAYSDVCIYAWGANHGQLGLDANTKSLPLPKQLKLQTLKSIHFVEANNSATVVVSKDNMILLFYNEKTRVLRAPNCEAIKSVSVVGGDGVKSAKGTATALKLLVLTQTNVIFLWYEIKQSFYRCIFSQIRLAQIDKIYYKANQVFVLSQGDVYRGKCHQVPMPYELAQKSGNTWSRCDMNRTEISTGHLIRIDLQRLPNIDRAVDIHCDDDFSSFAVLQESAMKYFRPPTLTAEEYSFKKLYSAVSELDAVHDVVFRVDGVAYAAHKFIVYARAPGLRPIVEAYADKHVPLQYERLTGKMFELLLKYVYTNHLLNQDDLDDIQQSLGPDSPDDSGEVCRVFLEFVEKFQLQNLANYLKSWLQREPFSLPNHPDKSKCRFNRLRQTDLPELYDVRIVCSGGDVELPAHKCMLVARLEYFDMMFTHSWAEQTAVNLSSVPVEYIRPIVDFLYSSDVEQFRRQNYSETFLYNMIVFCDQFFIERLRKVCEISILEKISMRKCGEMLDFAYMYNCEVLKVGCMEFICQNLARVLTYRSLDHCEPEALNCLNTHYRNMFKDVFDYRMITPDSEAIEDELLLSFVDDFQVDLSYRMDDQEAATFKLNAKQKPKDSKAKLATRQYERDAISTMMQESLSLNDGVPMSRGEQSKLSRETQEISEKLQKEASAWMMVQDKKVPTKKLSLECALKANEALRAEEKCDGQKVSSLTPLKLKSPEQETTSKSAITSPPACEAVTTPTVAYNLTLSDFTPAREKLSQKQRKRLISESAAAPVLRAPHAPPAEQTQPLAVPAQPNAWGTLPQSPPSTTAYAMHSSPPTGSVADPTSFANMMRVSSASPAAALSTENSFAKILADERKQRDYYERMRGKSLALTQIEETAIAELREFYNVDNVTDEVITIERKSVPKTMNFAVWQRH